MHIQPTSQETPVNDLNNPILLFFSHLVIARQTEATAENISSHVSTGALDVGIGSSPTVALDGYKGMGTVDRLHMHEEAIRTSAGYD